MTNLRIIWGFKDVRPGYTKSGGFSDIKSTLTWLCVYYGVLSWDQPLEYNRRRIIWGEKECFQEWAMPQGMIFADWYGCILPTFCHYHLCSYIYLWKINATGHDICWPSYKSSRTTSIRFIWLPTFWCNLLQKVYFIVGCKPYIVRDTFIFCTVQDAWISSYNSGHQLVWQIHL